MLKKNNSLEVLSVESNFISGDGAVSIIKALQHCNISLRELKIDNQRHLFGANVENEFAKRLKDNHSLTKFSYQFQNAGLRMTCNNFITRNVDHVRRLRVQHERSLPQSQKRKPFKPKFSNKTEAIHPRDFMITSKFFL